MPSEGCPKTHNIRQIHVLDSVWRSKTGSTGKFTFEVDYDLLWNGTYQHDLNNAAGERKGKILFPNKLIHLMNLTMILEKTPHWIKTMMVLPHTQSFNLLLTLLSLKNLPRFLFPTNFGGEFSEATKKLIIEYDKRVKVVNPKPYFNGGDP